MSRARARAPLPAVRHHTQARPPTIRAATRMIITSPAAAAPAADRWPAAVRSAGGRYGQADAASRHAPTRNITLYSKSYLGNPGQPSGVLDGPRRPYWLRSVGHRLVARIDRPVRLSYSERCAVFRCGPPWPGTVAGGRWLSVAGQVGQASPLDL